jgi:ankyrin repeat protein
MKLLILPLMLIATLPTQAAPGGTVAPNGGKDWRTDDSWVNTQTRSFDVAAEGTVADVAKFINSRGKAVLREADASGNTMLHYAVRDNPDPEVIRRLLYLGANSKTANNQGLTPLMAAIRYNVDDTNVELLLLNGAEPNARDRKGETSLFYVVNYRPDAALIQTLIRYGANAALRNQAGKTALNIAVQRKCEADVIAALSTTTTPQFDTNGDTPLTQAVRNGDVDAIQKLKLAGANFNQTNFYGMTPLMVAASYSQSATVINALLDCGADITWCDRYGRTALDYAVRYNNPIAINILRNWGRSHHRRYDEPVIIRQNSYPVYPAYPAASFTYRQDSRNRDINTTANIGYHQNPPPPPGASRFHDPDNQRRRHWYDNVDVYPSATIIISGNTGHTNIGYGLGFGFSFR